jgi:hypothetical protein
MMDVLEAIKGLDGYSETLASLGTLLGANLFEGKGEEFEALLAQLKEEQKQGRWLAREIMKEIHDVGAKADRSGDMTGLSAAIQRFVAADNQAGEALNKKNGTDVPNAVSEALRRFRINAGLMTE